MFYKENNKVYMTETTKDIDGNEVEIPRICSVQTVEGVDKQIDFFQAQLDTMNELKAVIEGGTTLEQAKTQIAEIIK